MKIFFPLHETSFVILTSFFDPSNKRRPFHVDSRERINHRERGFFWNFRAETYEVEDEDGKYSWEEGNDPVVLRYGQRQRIYTSQATMTNYHAAELARRTITKSPREISPRNSRPLLSSLPSSTCDFSYMSIDNFPTHFFFISSI